MKVRGAAIFSDRTNGLAKLVSCQVSYPHPALKAAAAAGQAKASAKHSHPATTTAPRHPPMAATATLTNCYAPLPAASSAAADVSADFDPFSRLVDTSTSDADGRSLQFQSNDGHQTGDGSSQPDAPAAKQTRGPRGLRQLHLSRGILSQSTGSALVEWGHTKLVVSVRGPRPVNCSSLNAANGGGGLVCEVRYLPHVGIRPETLARHSLSSDFSSKTPAGARIPRDALGSASDLSPLSSGGAPGAPAAFLDEAYLSRRLREALAPAAMVDSCGGKVCVEVFVEVLQSDGGVFNAAVVGASLALADAGVGLRDVVCAASAAVVKTGKLYHAIADPTEDEILQASGVVTIAMMPNWREVTVWDQFGKMSIESSKEALELARDGCATMHKFLKNCLTNGKDER
ncbi:hypothetical protein ACHAXT_013040 [Thalassiosira profunda]